MLWEIARILVNRVNLGDVQVALVEIDITHIHSIINIDLADVLQVDVLRYILALIVALDTFIRLIHLFVHNLLSLVVLGILMSTIDMAEINIYIDLTFITFITLKILVGVLFHSFWNVIYDVFRWWNAALWYVLIFVVLAVMGHLGSSSCILLCHGVGPLWDFSLLVLILLINIWNRSLAPALLDALVVFWCAAIELLDWVVLLEGSNVLSLLAGFVCSWDAGSWPHFVCQVVRWSCIYAVFIREARWDF